MFALVLGDYIDWEGYQDYQIYVSQQPFDINQLIKQFKNEYDPLGSYIMKETFVEFLLLQGFVALQTPLVTFVDSFVERVRQSDGSY